VQLQGYNLVGSLKAWWGGSRGWSVVIKAYRKDRLGRCREEVAFYGRAQLECLELCLGMDEEPAEGL